MYAQSIKEEIKDNQLFYFLLNEFDSLSEIDFGELGNKLTEIGFYSWEKENISLNKNGIMFS